MLSQIRQKWLKMLIKPDQHAPLSVTKSDSQQRYYTRF